MRQRPLVVLAVRSWSVSDRGPPRHCRFGGPLSCSGLCTDSVRAVCSSASPFANWNRQPRSATSCCVSYLWTALNCIGLHWIASGSIQFTSSHVCSTPKRDCSSLHLLLLLLVVVVFVCVFVVPTHNGSGSNNGEGSSRVPSEYVHVCVCSMRLAWLVAL